MYALFTGYNSKEGIFCLKMGIVIFAEPRAKNNVFCYNKREHFSTGHLRCGRSLKLVIKILFVCHGRVRHLYRRLFCES